MKAIQTPTGIKKESEYGNVFKGSVGFKHLSDEQKEELGFRDIIEPTLGENEKATTLYYDDSTDTFKYNIIDKTSEEIKAEKISKEKNSYTQKMTDGHDYYLEIISEQRVRFSDGEITEKQFKDIEKELKKVRDELFAGSWGIALEELVAVGDKVLGLDLYNQIHTYITNYITLNY